ncbi:hypothetical protein RR21198_4846, partial [Rhodococcus rhodochrous ATCC 21198]
MPVLGYLRIVRALGCGSVKLCLQAILGGFDFFPMPLSRDPPRV